MPTDQFSIQITDCGGPAHHADLEELAGRGLPVPHEYTTWPRFDSAHRWRWCRVLDEQGKLITAFSVELSRSRALPGTLIGRIDRLGRGLHAAVLPNLGPLLREAARQIPRLQRLDVRVFDEDASRRGRYCASIAAYGGTRLADPPGYLRTAALDLGATAQALLASLKPKVRASILAFTRHPGARTAEISDPAFLPRLQELYAAAFQRTGSQVPAVDFHNLLRDASEGGLSVLVGAFVRDGTAPGDLVAFAWARLHGDHVEYSVGGSDRSADLRGASATGAVLCHIGNWARAHGASWVDLGGVTAPHVAASHPLSGISSFKRRLASREFEVACEYGIEARPGLVATAESVRRARDSLRRLLPRKPADTPVLVLGSGITALGVLRICHRAGIPAWSLVPSTGPDRSSRWYVPAPMRAHSEGAPTDLAGRLEACLLPRAVLMPCSDAMTLQAAELTGSLAERFPASVASPAAIRTLVDKAAFAGALARVGVPHPITRTLTGPAELEDVAEDVLAGAFLKPHDSQQFFARFGVKAFRIHSREQAVKRMTAVEQAGLHVLLQEYVPGPGSLHYLVDGFIDRHGVSRAVFTRRRLRMYPRDFGNSSFMVSVPVSEMAQAVDAALELLAHLKYRGIYSAEFKRDPRDGMFKLLEVNARPWWYIEYAERSGVDVCSMAYHDALDRQVANVRDFRVGTRLVYPYTDYFACREAWQAGELSLLDWARSWIGAQHPLFNWSDPGPALAEARTILWRRVTRGLRKEPCP